MVMKGNRDLDQSLKELAFWFRRSPPDVLKNLVGFEELSGIEEIDAAVQRLRMHGDSVAHGLLLRGGGSTHQLFDLGELFLSVGHLGWVCRVTQELPNLFSSLCKVILFCQRQSQQILHARNVMFRVRLHALAGGMLGGVKFCRF